MNILFITSSRIGDAVLSTGLLKYLHDEYPSAFFTIACGPLCASLFEGVPNLKNIYPVKKEKHHKHWLKLWKKIVGTQWDIVVDLRNSAVSRLVFAKKRYIFGPHIDKSLHKVEQNAAVLKIFEAPPAPHLWFTADQAQKAAIFIPSGAPVLGVGPTANWIGKTWPVENFIEVVQKMTAKGAPMHGARVAVFAAPGEEENAIKLLQSIPETKRIDLIAKTDPGVAAACLARCDFYLGNDSGLMHCAAATGVPTIGVFGPSYPHLYRPWGDHTAFARTEQSFDELIDFEGYNAKTLDHSLMTSVSVETVYETADRLLKRLKTD
jgi:lipopolysaccharide export system permease protein